MAMFFGRVVGRAISPFVPGGSPNDSILHLSQASVLASVKEGKRASLMAKFGSSDAEPVCLATLTAGRQDSVALDIFLDRYTEFSVLGDVEVHLSGYFAPPDTLPGGDEEDDSEDDEEYTGQGEGDSSSEDEEALQNGEGLQNLQALRRMIAGGDLEEGSSDEEGDSEEEEDEDEEDDSEDDEEEDEDEPKAPHCVIEEINEQQEEVVAPVGSKRAALEEKQEGPNKKQKALEAPQQPQQEQQQQQQKQQQKEQKQQQKEQKQQQQQQQKGKQETPSKDGSAAGEVKTNKKNVRRWENGFEIEELAMGQPNGKLAKAGKKCMMKYVGRLKSTGKVFDQTQGKKTFAFRLGVGEVIKGWDLGVQGMRVGDKRRIVIPPQLGYGSSGVKGAIPPNATLEFEMELVDVK